MKSALSSILVVLGACERASADVTPPPPPAPATASAVTVAPAPAASSASSVPVAKTTAARVKTAPKTVYVCPMHPEVVSDVPGLCPKCNMKLDPKPQVTEVRAADERPEAPAAP